HPLKAARPAVGNLRGIEANAVVTPVAFARELGYRHELDGRDAQVPQPVEIGDDSVESAFRRKSPDVELVQDVVAQRRAEPVLILPVEATVNEFRGAVHPLRLGSGRRVATLLLLIESIPV